MLGTMYKVQSLIEKFINEWKATKRVLVYTKFLHIDITTCNPLSHYNKTFPINLGLSNHVTISWTLKSTSATTFTIRNSRERLPGDASLPPSLMNIYSKKMAGKKVGKFWLKYCPSRLFC